MLNLEGNGISYLSRDSFMGLRELVTLKLNNNNLRNVTEPVFENLKQLETLDLSRNEISYLSDAAFSGLNSLRSLQLRRNRLGLLVTPNDAEIEKTVVLTVDGLRADHLPNLTTLDLGDINFPRVAKYWSPFSSSEGYRNVMFVWFNLKELLLDGCAIDSIEPGSFDGLVSLLILKLRNNNLKVCT